VTSAIERLEDVLVESLGKPAASLGRENHPSPTRPPDDVADHADDVARTDGIR
jgi:hypothetical protein